MNDFQPDDAAIERLLNSEYGPVGHMLDQLSEEIVTVARSRVRVRVPGTDRTGRTSDARPPGFTLASIRTDVHYSPLGELFGGASAAEDPAIYLEYPAEQDHRKYPFSPRAWTAWITGSGPDMSTYLLHALRAAKPGQPVRAVA